MLGMTLGYNLTQERAAGFLKLFCRRRCDEQRSEESSAQEERIINFRQMNAEVATNKSQIMSISLQHAYAR